MSRETQISKLKDDLANGRVVTVAGTGVSVAATGNQEIDGCKVATWPGLLSHGVRHCRSIGVIDDDEVTILELQIKKAKVDLLISAAEMITQRLTDRSPGVYRAWLSDTIGQLVIQNRELLDAVAALPGVLTTLNYDNLLEEATSRTALTWIKTDEVQDVLSGAREDAVLHLHGWHREPESVVLGLKSYEAVKEHLHAKAVLNLFTIDRTLLFVGCGETVNDPNFSRLIEWGKNALQDIKPRHHILCRRSDVDEFQKKLAAAPWLQPLPYGDEYSELPAFLIALVSQGQIQQSREPVRSAMSIDLDAYSKVIGKQFRHLRLDEIEEATHDFPELPLTGMFVTQYVRASDGFVRRDHAKDLALDLAVPNEDERRRREREERRHLHLAQSPRPIVEVIGAPKNRLLVILGDPGSGKTTILQYLLLAWSGLPPGDRVRARLPLLIDLRDYGRWRSKGGHEGILEYLDRAPSVRFQLNRESLHAWLQKNQTQILLDGFDEVFDKNLRKEISTTVYRLADAYPLASVIVTSRVYGYSPEPWRAEGFKHYVLQELDDQQIADFLARWHQYAFDDTAHGEQRRILLEGAIEGSAAIRQLAGNPLLLTMLAILNRSQDLPHDRVELYGQCTRLLLHRWKPFDSVELLKASLDYRDKQRLLLRVARAMRTSKSALVTNTIDEDTLEKTLEAALAGVRNIRPDRLARAMIQQLRGRNFILTAIGGGSYAFVHRTFLEYFCSLELRELFESEQSLSLEALKSEIYSHWRDQRWHETLSLLSGLLAPRFVKDVVEWLLNEYDPASTGLQILLAVRCVGEVRNIADLGAARDDVLKRAQELVECDFDSIEDDGAGRRDIAVQAVSEIARSWRGSSHVLAWLRMTAERSGELSVRRAAIQGAARGWKDAAETLKWLRALAETDSDVIVRWVAMEELGRGWRNDPETQSLLTAFAGAAGGDARVRANAVRDLARRQADEKWIRQYLYSCAERDVDASVREAAVQVVSSRWKSATETFRVLRRRIENDEDGEVRQAALRGLVDGWSRDSETLRMLQFVAKHDRLGRNREMAVRELVAGWKDLGDTLDFVRFCAECDDAATVRMMALGELAREWRDDLGVRGVIQARASLDDHGSVRQTAIEELARAWPGDLEILAFLHNRADVDESWYVRQAIVEELGRNWEARVEVLELIQLRAVLDMSWSVRMASNLQLASMAGETDGVQDFIRLRSEVDEDQRVRRSAELELAKLRQIRPEARS